MDEFLTFPLWTCVDSQRRQYVGSDPDGNPDLSVWDVRGECLRQLPPGTRAVPLDRGTFVRRLRQLPGDSGLSIHLAAGCSVRMPLKRMLAAMLASRSLRPANSAD